MNFDNYTWLLEYRKGEVYHEKLFDSFWQGKDYLFSAR